MNQDVAITALLIERAAQANLISDLQVSATTILICLQPHLAATYQRPDCQQPLTAAYHDSELLSVQGLGVQGFALRYQVKSIRLGSLNDAGTFTTFTLSIAGIRSNLLVSDQVVDKALYLNVDRNLSLALTAAMLQDLYQVETSSSALDRSPVAEAQALPSIGQLIQRLNQNNRSRRCISTNRRRQARRVGNWPLRTNMGAYCFRSGSRSVIPGIFK